MVIGRSATDLVAASTIHTAGFPSADVIALHGKEIAETDGVRKLPMTGVPRDQWTSSGRAIFTRIVPVVVSMTGAISLSVAVTPVSGFEIGATVALSFG